MLRVDEEDDPASSDRVGLAGDLLGDPAADDRHAERVIVRGDRDGHPGITVEVAALREPGPVKKATWSRSSPIHTGTLCGAPSGSTVAMWA